MRRDLGDDLLGGCIGQLTVAVVEEVHLLEAEDPGVLQLASECAPAPRAWFSSSGPNQPFAARGGDR
jgi:hypothetical protein